MKIKDWKRILFSLIILTFIVSSCEKKTYYDINFIVKNECEEQIKVDYSIRVCSSIHNDCSPQDFFDLINQHQSTQLYIKDNISEDGNIEDVFYELDIYKGSEKSNFNFCNTEKLSETKYDDKIEYILTVDSTFFE